MKAVFLTQAQIDEAVERARQLKTNLPQFEVPVSPIVSEIISLDEVPNFKLFTLRFRREFYVDPKTGDSYYVKQLITPIQVVEEWLARQMQSTND